MTTKWLHARVGDLVKCVDGMGSLALYDRPSVGEWDLDGHVGDLTYEQLALVVDVVDTGFGREGIDRYRALLVVSGTELVGWCKNSSLLRRA